MAKSAAPSPPVSAATRFLVLHGKDRFLQDEHLRVLRESLIKQHGAEGVDTVKFDGAQGQRIIADVLDECRSFGLMQQHKVILIDNAEILLKADDEAPAPKSLGKGKRAHIPQSARELLESYAESPSDSATLVLRANIWRSGNLDKAILAGGGTILKCEAPTLAEAAAWAQKRAQVRHETSIDPRAAAALVSAVGSELGRIDNELEKLALAAIGMSGGKKGAPITLDLVESMTGVTREEEFWSIQAALLSPVAAEPLGQLRDLIEVSRHDPVPISFAYMEMARKVHTAARGLAEGVAPQRILGALKIWGPGSEQMGAAILETAKSAGPSAAARLFDLAVATDAANKSSLGEPVRNLEVLTVRFNQLAARRRR